ncbi:MAG TPA: DNA-binding domain-containing protein [Paludibacter sp.]
MSSNQHHQIKALLFPNLLKNNKGTFKAQVIASQARGIKDICNSFCNKRSSGLDPETLEYHVRLFLEEMSELLDDGVAINTGYFAATPTIKGSFNSKSDKFDAEKHRVTYKFSQGALLRKRAAKVEAEILHGTSANFGFMRVKDIYSGSLNDLLTPGRNLKFEGTKLKLCGTHPDVGIYFISKTTGQRTKVPSKNMITNQNKNLLILTPVLQPDSYRLEHITQYAGKGTLLNEPRSTMLTQILQVV